MPADPFANLPEKDVFTARAQEAEQLSHEPRLWPPQIIANDAWRATWHIPVRSSRNRSHNRRGHRVDKRMDRTHRICVSDHSTFANPEGIDSWPSTVQKQSVTLRTNRVS